MAQNRTIVGIDIAKDKVDVALRAAGIEASFENTPSGRRQLVKWVKQHQVDKAVMEASGGYERSWARLLQDAGLEVWIVDPKRVRRFAQSAGQLAKTDRIDARMIAWFGETFADGIGRQPDAAREELDRLVSARTDLMELRRRLAHLGEDDQPDQVRRCYRKIERDMKEQVAALEATIETRVAAEPRFAELARIIRSVPNLGRISVAGVIAFLPELGLVRNKQASALVGLAPYEDSSGKHQGRRFIQGGRRKLRNLLYLPIVGAATRGNPVLKAYYKRLRDNGKEPKVALIACMRKMIVILNTMGARGETWDPQKHAIA
jgi:transposase